MKIGNLNNVEIELLRRAFKSHDGVFIGGITSTMGISIKDASIAFRNLRRFGLLRERGGSLLLTSRGRSWVMEHQNLFAFSREKKWREVPKHFEANSVQPYEPYAPRISKLDKRYFGLGSFKHE